MDPAEGAGSGAPTAVQMLLENPIKHDGSTPRKPLHTKATAC